MPDPIVKGGQGRSSRRVNDDAMALTLLAIALLIALLIAGGSQ